MISVRLPLCLLCFFVFIISAYPQDLTEERIINVTLDTSEPDQLQINHGRLIWRDKDPGTGTYNLKFYSGAEIFKIDSGLTGLISDIDGDHIVWNSSAGDIKIFNIKDWSVSSAGSSYPDYDQPVSVANGKIAYVRSSGNGTEIVLKNLVTGEDTVFSAGVWNLEPSLNHGQLAWVQKFLTDTTTSNIYFFDGQTVKHLTNTAVSGNFSPVVKDGQVEWLQYSDFNYKVILFDGDSSFVITETGPGEYISGYDLSCGIAVASSTDSLTNNTEIRIYNSETGAFTALDDTGRIHGLHIDSRFLCWVSGSGASRVLVIYDVESGITQEWGSAVNPVIDDEQVAWTLGDAVSMLVPVTYLQLSSGDENGWPQSRFKPNEGDKVIWGNLDNSTNARLFYSDGNSAIQLTDSLVYKDFIMLNDDIAVWRHDFTSLYLYDGINPPELIVDSLQCENMYLADGLIGFHGFRVDAGNNINQAWLYKIEDAELMQLSDDTADGTANTFTLTDDGKACWFRDSSNITMLMYYDGVTAVRITDSLVYNEFSYVDGKIVWSETSNGVFQIMMYDVNSGITSQLSDGVNEKYRPVTDGKKVIWIENTDEGSILWYYDIVSQEAVKVAHIDPPVARWLWLSNGKTAWSSGGEVCVYDGKSISRLTSSAPFNPNMEPFIDNDIVVWNKNNPEPNINNYGQVFRGKLHPHVSFDADNIAGSNPLTVTFKNNSFQGVQYYHWDFGDGQTSTEENPSHTYQNPGTYTVTLTAGGITGSRTEKKINLVRAVPATSISGKDLYPPGKFRLYQNYPNPFNPFTTFRFDLPRRTKISLKLYNIMGEQVAVILDEEMEAGPHTINWSAVNLASGIYIYQLKAAGYSDTKVLHLIK